MPGNKLIIERLLSLCRTYNESCKNGITADGLYMRRRLNMTIDKQLQVVQNAYTSVKLEKDNRQRYLRLIVDGKTYDIQT